MRTALTVITTAILTAIAFLFAWQEGWLGNAAMIGGTSSCPVIDTTSNNTAGDDENKNCIEVEEGKSCETPRGDLVVHAEAVLSFEAEAASGDISCNGKTSVCNDGAWLDNEAPYNYASCTLNTEDGIVSSGLKHCVVGDIMVPHDSTNTFYKEIKNGSAYSYESLKRYCFDGQLDGELAYNKLNLISSCNLKIVEPEPEVVVAPKPVVKPVAKPYVAPEPKEPVYARCTGPFGGVWTHGQQGTVYRAGSVPYGSSCESLSVVCGYGSIRYGTTANIGQPLTQKVYGSCNVGTPAGCTTACGNVEHGQNVTTYAQGTLPFGSSQTCNDNRIVSSCNDGTLSPSAGSACSCEIAEPVGCTTACGSVAHGGSIKTYAKGVIPYGAGETCSENLINSTCSNGALSPGAGTACSCSVQQPVGCVAPNGQQVAHGSSITLYKDKTIQPVAWDGSDTCVRQGGKCKNGGWHDFNGNPTTLTFQYSTCTILPPPAGEGPGGEGVPQG